MSAPAWSRFVRALRNSRLIRALGRRARARRRERGRVRARVPFVLVSRFAFVLVSAMVHRAAMSVPA
jgi:hypothetical protein